METTGFYGGITLTFEAAGPVVEVVVGALYGDKASGFVDIGGAENALPVVVAFLPVEPCLARVADDTIDGELFFVFEIVGHQLLVIIPVGTGVGGDPAEIAVLLSI